MAVDLSSLSGGVKAAYLALVEAKAAGALGLGADAVKFFEESFERRLQRARIEDLEATASSDPVVREVLAAVRAPFAQDDPKLPVAMDALFSRIDATRAAAFTEVRDAHAWSWLAATPSATPESAMDGLARAAFVTLLAERLAVPCGLGADAVQLLAQKYQTQIARAVAADLNAQIDAADDALAKAVFASVRSAYGFDDAKLPPSVSGLVGRVKAVAPVALDEVKAAYPWTGVDAETPWENLPGLVKAAYLASVTATVAVGLGLDAQAAAAFEQKKALALALAKKGELDAALAKNEDPILAQLVANFRSDDAGLAGAYAIYTQRVNAVALAAYEEVERSHGWRWIDSSWTDETPLDERLAAMDGLAKSAYVALVVRQLAAACGIAPEMAQVYEQQYQTRLRAARVADLETTPVVDEVQREVLALVRDTFSGDTALPRDMKAITDRIDALKDMARKEVLSAHDWSFAEADYACDAAMTEHPDRLFPYHVTLPKGCLLVSACYGEDGKVTQWKLRGREIHARRRLSRVVYVRDVEDFAAWHPKAYRAFVLRLVADVAKCVASNPKDRAFQEQLYRDALEEAKVCDARSSNAPDEAWGDNEIADAMLVGSSRREFDDPLYRG